MDKLIIIQFLKSFFLLFRASIFEYKIFEKKIFGTVEWLNDGEKQDFTWTLEFDDASLSKINLLCNFLNDNNLIEGDRVIIPENKLLLKLIASGWNEGEAKRAINELCSIDIKMVDEGEETDSFFIHF